MDKESFYTKMKRLGLWDKPISELANFIDEKDKEIAEKDKEIERMKREMAGRGFIGYPDETSNRSTPPLEIKK